MDLYVFLAVLAAAACHAGWNAGLKTRLPPDVAITLISVVAGIIAIPLWPLVGNPAVESLPYLGTSLFLHLFYYVTLAEAYRTGDLGQVYPIARGSAPLMTAVGSVGLFGESLSGAAWGGVFVLTSGIVLLSLRGGRPLAGVDRRAIGFALATALTIAAYTLVDGRGSRLSGNPHGYAVVLFVFDGVMMAAFGAVRQRTALRKVGWDSLPLVTGGAVLAFASYWTAIWAMSVAPIPLVAAVRETSVLFAAMISFFLLREPLILARVIAALLVMAGLILIRFN
jgi:drug/metabolite transporter (DMT)-like permease